MTFSILQKLPNMVKSVTVSPSDKVEPNENNFPDGMLEELQHAIWPNDDHDKFCKTLDEWPDLMELKNGPLLDTLLHRYVGT